MALLLAGCAGSNVDKDKAQKDYKQSLSDSIALCRQQMDSCENRLKTLTDNVNEWMRDFTVVSNPREVESYYIYNGWQNKYPLQSTGVVARISNGEKLELIAALKNSTFNSLRVESAGQSAETAIVPHDQALNYRREGINTVMFSGKEADAVAQLIADNELNPIRVVYLENGKVKSSWQMPENYKKNVSATWMLYSSRMEQMRLEGYQHLLSRKIDLFRAHKDK